MYRQWLGAPDHHVVDDVRRQHDCSGGAEIHRLLKFSAHIVVFRAEDAVEAHGDGAFLMSVSVFGADRVGNFVAYPGKFGGPEEVGGVCLCSEVQYPAGERFGTAGERLRFERIQLDFRAQVIAPEVTIDVRKLGNQDVQSHTVENGDGRPAGSS
ncbi:MAG: hypothetical protein K0Q46_3897 [Rhodococcus erythropolis]|nr:hypothetical protein [Rhodococcus erythropolis]